MTDSTESPMKEEQKRRRGKHYKRPATKVILQEIAIHEIESQQTSERNRNAQAFFPPRDCQPNDYANRKENQPEPLPGRNL